MKLAINGGPRITDELFPAQRTIGQEEKLAVARFLDEDKPLSGFRGNSTPNFFGGEYVQLFEERWCGKFGNAFAISVNSCTSALITACGAIGLQPGDEVIVTPWSMSCSATAPLVYGATPIFVDIEKDYFCIDPEKIEKRITDKTKAIIIVDLFGQPFDVDVIRYIAKKHKLFIIEDAAQAPGAKFKKEYTGSLGDISCFSFTQGKHLTAGEGGMITTNDPILAHKCRLIRNHSEAVISDTEPLAKGGVRSYGNNMVGFNFRMTELQAVIMIEQLKKLNDYIHTRQVNAAKFNDYVIENVPPIIPTKIRKDCEHVYYAQAFLWDKEKADGITRDKYIEAVKTELVGEEGRPDKGVSIGCGYIKPLNDMPIFVTKGNRHWAAYDQAGTRNCTTPVAWDLYEEKLIITTIQQLPLGQLDFYYLRDAFEKVWDNREELK